MKPRLFYFLKIILTVTIILTQLAHGNLYLMLDTSKEGDKLWYKSKFENLGFNPLVLTDGALTTLNHDSYSRDIDRVSSNEADCSKVSFPIQHRALFTVLCSYREENFPPKMPNCSLQKQSAPIGNKDFHKK